MSGENCTPPRVNLAEIEEWLCDVSKTIPDPPSQTKFAEAAQCVRSARFMLGVFSQGHSWRKEALELIGEEILSPAAQEEIADRRYDGGRVEVIKKPNPWLDGLNWLFRR